MSQEFNTFGREVVLDVKGVDFQLLNNVRELEQQLVDAAEECDATVVGVLPVKFNPQGATVAVVLSESHLTIHTYPEKGFAGLNCYTCGSSVDPELAIRYLIEVMKPNSYSGVLIYRGQEGPLKVVPFE
ncbi:adenosylmethionine decarboxylase [Shimazuella sp. AN120528]|uniref:adenosylmethionine decarboxylase n=1 Tax=Shimazuella soli TaxID=1892854 RepID=UPI001F0E2B65|nr:adenosylmethionine decarboxylase [Shimazuella soli]